MKEIKIFEMVRNMRKNTSFKNKRELTLQNNLQLALQLHLGYNASALMKIQ